MDSRLQLIAGTVGRGRGRYEGGRFILPDRSSRLVLAVASLEVNGAILQGSWTKRVGSGVGTAVAAAQLGAVTGLFVGGMALVGPYALSGAAIGAGLGLFGGGAIKKSLVQILFDDDTGFIAICDGALPDRIRGELKALETARKAGNVALQVQAPPRALPMPAASEPVETVAKPGVFEKVRGASQGAVVAGQEAAKVVADRAGQAAAQAASLASSVAGRVTDGTSTALGAVGRIGRRFRGSRQDG